MRKYFGSFIFVIIALFLIRNTNAIAQNETGKIPQQDSATASGIVPYDLAFPGILPDHPLYKLKVLRDKLLISFIANPEKRVDFYVLKADKGILATAMLIDKNKIKLAEETALKAEHNYTLLTEEFYKFREKPKAEFFQKLKTASLKHQEVLNSLIQRLPVSQQETFKTVLYFSKLNLKSVEKFENKKFYDKQ